MEVGNLLADIPAELPEELFSELLRGKNFRLERIVSRGQATPPGQWYDQAWDEWVLLFQGEATLTVEGLPAPVRLGPGDHLLLPAHCRHRVEWTAADGDTLWLALHFSDSDFPIE